MENYKFEFNTQEDMDFVSLVIKSLKSIDEIFSINKKDSDLSYESARDDNFMNVIFASSRSWLDEIITYIENSYNNQVNFTLDQRNFLIIKYFTEMYWDHTGQYDVNNVGCDLKLHFNKIEESVNLKKTFKVVK